MNAHGSRANLDWRRRLLSSAGLAGVAMFGVMTPAYAQDASESSSASADSGELVVTGTRVVRDGYNAPTPTTVLGAEEIQAQAPSNIADFVNRLPQLSATTTPRNTRFVVGGGLGGANMLNLRELGTNRTLTMLGGRRVVPASIAGGVDINLLPSALVERVDVVTGGASAAWGSDAVAGVVNFVLDTDFTGLTLSAQAGQTQQNDGQTLNFTATYGTSFANGRGHFLFSGQYASADSIDRADSRDWFNGYKLIGNPGYTPTNGQPGMLVRPNVGLSRETDGGLIWTGPLAGIQFGEGGQPLPFTFGSIVSGLVQYGGTPNDVAGGAQLLAPLDQYSLFARASYEFTPGLTGYVELSYGESVSEYISSPFWRHGDITVRIDNAFLPESVRDQMVSAGVTTFQMGRTNYDLGSTLPRNDRTLERIVLGLDGRLGDSSSWSFYYQRGESTVLNAIANNPIRSRYNAAIDTVLNPAVGGVAGVPAGVPVCRSTLTAPTNGCVPMNIFGYGSPSPESVAWVMGVARQETVLVQDVAALSAQFEPFSTWAGPVSIVGGVEYRRESYKADADAISQASNFWVGNYKPGSGEYDVTEGFVESIIPLLSGVAFAEQLDLNLAARYTDYSTSGGVTTWKVGVTYDVTTELRLRLTRSRDIRAPNLNELFLGGQSNAFNTPDPLLPGAPTVALTQVTGGNPNLTPEIADTLAYGFVYRPNWLPGFATSIDYYSIDIEDAIVAQTLYQIVNGCYGYGVPQVASYCSAITLATPGTIAGARVNVSGVNVQSLSVAGIDLEVSYASDLEAIGLPGDVSIRAVGTHVLENETFLGGVVNDLRRIEWRALFSLGYTLGPSTTVLSVRYLGDSVYNHDPVGASTRVDNNHIPSRTYLDLSQTFDLSLWGADAQIFGVVENLLDQDPPVVAPGDGANYIGYGTSPIYYDTLGRSFRLGVRLKY